MTWPRFKRTGSGSGCSDSATGAASSASKRAALAGSELGPLADPRPPVGVPAPVEHQALDGRGQRGRSTQAKRPQRRSQVGLRSPAAASAVGRATPVGVDAAPTFGRRHREWRGRRDRDNRYPNLKPASGGVLEGGSRICGHPGEGLRAAPPARLERSQILQVQPHTGTPHARSPRLGRGRLIALGRRPHSLRTARAGHRRSSQRAA